MQPTYPDGRPAAVPHNRGMTESTWTAPELTPADGPLVGPDRPMLEAYLDWQRATLLHICAGLTAAQLAERALPPSNLSLLGLVRHLAKVERYWFRELLGKEGLPRMYDPALGKDADFDAIDPADAPAAVDRLQEESRRARSVAAGYSFDETRDHHGETMSLRMIYVHMIGEYARHNGHADLLRERIDGATGR
jgi:uncharacterized damage-inducible protein DinB